MIEPQPPRFVIYRLKLAEQYCPPGTPPEPVEYIYCIFDTHKNEFLQAVESIHNEDDPDLNYLCDLLNGMDAQLKAYEELVNGIRETSLSAEQHDLLRKIWEMEDSAVSDRSDKQP